MSLSTLLGITAAYAEAAGIAAPAAAGQAGGFLSMLPMLLIFMAVFYFLLVRPQQKRAKDHKKLMDSLSIGDEVITTGGLVGKLTKLRDKQVHLEVAKGIEMMFQRSAVVSVLPKGTVDSIQ